LPPTRIVESRNYCKVSFNFKILYRSHSTLKGLTYFIRTYFLCKKYNCKSRHHPNRESLIRICKNQFILNVWSSYHSTTKLKFLAYCPYFKIVDWFTYNFYCFSSHNKAFPEISETDGAEIIQLAKLV
jgi:hypothetical protein